MTLTLLSPALVGCPVVLNRLQTAPPLENTDRAWALLECFLDSSLLKNVWHLARVGI